MQQKSRGMPRLFHGHPVSGEGFSASRIRFLFCSEIPLKPGKQAGRIPEGRRARCATFPDGTGTCLPEMPRLIADRFREAGPTG